jgi:GGDEF domain-containing protein
MEDVAEADDSVAVAEKILACLKRPFLEDGHEFNIGASIGISTFPNDGDDAPTLLRNAGAAMHRAKNDGRNRFHF